MSIFRRHKAEPAPLRFSPEEYEPVLRCSICTGEQVACMREKSSGRLREVMLIRSEEDLECFCRGYHIEKEQIRKVY